MFLHIGFDNYVLLEKIDSINDVDSAPFRRKMQEARDDGKLIEASKGRKVRSIIITGDYIYTSALKSKALIERCTNE